MSVWRQRIPTILGLLVIVGGVIGSIFLVRERGILFLKAEPEATPKQIKITNITESSFVVSWITENEVLGFVKYGLDPSLENTALDERDRLSGKSTPFLIHHIRLENLQPQTKYYFKIGSGSSIYDNQGKAYEVITGPRLGTTPTADTVYGTILKKDGLPAEGVVVYLGLANSTPLSALTKSDGNWTIPLSMARASSLASFITYDPEASIEEIFVQGGKWGTATAIVTTRDDSPVPTITLGESYDFREKAPIVSPTPTPTPAGFSFEPPPGPPPDQEGLVIINPEEEEEISSQQPEFRGRGPKKEMLKIVIESPDVFTADVQIDENGNWYWTPPANLPPGEHTITATLSDGSSISRNFTILAAGEADFPAFTATPSGQISPTPTSPPLPLISPTPTPTFIPSPTPTPTPLIRKSIPSTEAGVPEPGHLTPTFTFVILGITLILSGLFLNLKLTL